MDQILLRRQINIKAVVTPLWKEDAQRQLQAQINQLDAQVQQLDVQLQQVIAELRKQKTDLNGEAVEAKIQEVQGQANTQKSELLQQKNVVLQQLNQVQTLEFEVEVDQGQMDNFFYVQKGDNLVQKMQVEILLRDGVIEDIRGTL